MEGAIWHDRRPENGREGMAREVVAAGIVGLELKKM